MNRNQKGFSLNELLVAVAIGAIISVVMATLFTFAVQQFQTMMAQGQAEENLLLASYYLRSTIAQAVKTYTAPFTFAADATEPTGVWKGFIDTRRTCEAATGGDLTCATMAASGAGWAGGGAINTLGVFVRENGDGTWGSDYAPTGIFYMAPFINAGVWQPGRIYIAQADALTGTFVTTQAAMDQEMYFDNIVAFGLAPSGAFPTPSGLFTAVNGNRLQSVTLYVRVRYYKGNKTAFSYDPSANTAAATDPNFHDLDMTINIGLRDNILTDAAVTGTGLPERLDGNLYFYRFLTPSLANF